jgi:dihydrofolate reductase
VEGIRHLKAQPGRPIIACGSSSLVPTLLEHGLVDEVLLAVYPVMLGCGQRILAHGAPARAFQLVGTTTFPSGIVLSTYHVAAPLPATPLR